jgi:hypothetical protein
MDGTPRSNTRPEAVVLWHRGEMTCTCRSHAADRVEILLVLADVVVESHLLSDAADASTFAIDKMHAYNGLPPARSRP